jgi:endonuclease/exonuclease/phosphatase family metal-dependent hydrolase
MSFCRFIHGSIWSKTAFAAVFLLVWATAQAAPLRVVTINVWSGLDYRGFWSFGKWEADSVREERFALLVAQLRALQPDIVFVQEANPVRSYSKKLGRALGMDEIHQMCNGGVKIGPVGVPLGFKEGNAILARSALKLHKLDEWKQSGGVGVFGDAISFHLSENISSLVGRIETDAGPLFVVNTHLFAAPTLDSTVTDSVNALVRSGRFTQTEADAALQQGKHGLARRAKELKRLRAQLAALPGEIPVIVAGDFNAPPTETCITEFTSSGGFIDSYRRAATSACTWDAAHNANVRLSCDTVDARGRSLSLYESMAAISASHPHRIDYICLSRHFVADDVRASRMVLDSSVNGLCASDHFGMLADVELDSLHERLQQHSQDNSQRSPHAIEFLPIAMYDTDTGFGYGIKLFYLGFAGGPESLDLTLFNSTKGERWYHLEYTWPDRERRQGTAYPFSFDVVADYDKWIKQSFFGIGSGARFAGREYYTKEPLEISMAFGHAFTPHIIEQIQFKYRREDCYHFEPGKQLARLPGSLVPARAEFGSVTLAVRYDTRNSYLNPSRGFVCEGEAEYEPFMTASHATFTRAAATVQSFSTLFYPKTVLALRAQTQIVDGDDLPLQVFLPIGGGTTLRGSPQDRYLDKVAAVANAELRFPIYWRFGGTIALDAGKVWDAPRVMNLRGWACNPTAGLRLYMNNFVVRADVGFGKETTGFYFNFGHAF